MLKRRSSEVQIPVLQTDIFRSIGVVADRDRRRIGGVDDLHLLSMDFDLAGCHLRIGIFAQLYVSPYLQDVFRADVFHLLSHRLIKDDLADARAVSEVHEDQASEVSSLADPADQRDRFAGIFFSESAVSTCAFHSVISLLPTASEYRSPDRGGHSPVRRLLSSG